MNIHDQLRQAIKDRCAHTVETILKDQPFCLSTSVDGCDENAQHMEPEWLGLDEKAWQARTNDLITIEKLLEYHDNNNAIILAIIQHNSSTLQFYDSTSYWPLLAYLINQSSDEEVLQLLETYPKYTVEYDHHQSAVLPLAFILIEQDRYELCLHVLQQHPPLIATRNNCGSNLLHQLTQRLLQNAEKIALQPINYPISINHPDEASLHNQYQTLISYIIKQAPELAAQINDNGSAPIHFAVYRSMEVFQQLLPHSNDIIHYLDVEFGNVLDLALNYVTKPAAIDRLLTSSQSLTPSSELPVHLDYYSCEDKSGFLRYLTLKSHHLTLRSPLIQSLICDHFTFLSKLKRIIYTYLKKRTALVTASSILLSAHGISLMVKI